MTIIVRNVDGVWQRITGVHTLTRMETTCTVTFHDGRQEEQDCDPYPVEEVLDIRRVAQLVAAGTWGATELEPYGLRTAVPFVLPEGEQVVGQASYSEVEGEIVETYDTEPVPAQPYRLYKSQFIARMSDAEAETLETVLAGADAKLRLMFNSVEYFVSDDPLFITLRATVAAALDDDARADELLGED